MADLVEGKLVWRGEKNKRQRFIVVATKSGTAQFAVSPEQLSAELQKDEADDIEVQAKRDGSGRPVLEVRPAGQEFKPSTAATPRLGQPGNIYEAAERRERERQTSDRRDPERGRARNQNQRQEAKDMSKREFHNPYNFVPAPERETAKGELKDRRPFGHDCYHSELFTGRLRAKLTVETPLLIPDTARVRYEPEDKNPEDAHKSFPLRLGIDGRPHLPVTSVKGMLRSAYEAVTNSRLSVFAKHDERLGFRMEATEGAMMVPVRIKGGPGKERIVFYTGTSELYKDGRPFNSNRETNRHGEPRNGLLCAAWLPMYTTEVRGSRENSWWIDNNAIRPEDEKIRLPKHGERVFAWVEEEDRSPRFKRWRVRKLAIKKASLGTVPAGLKEIEGYVCNTGQNIDRKHDEKIFFKDASNPLPINDVTLTQSLRDLWGGLIKNYRHEHDDGSGALKDPPSAIWRDPYTRQKEELDLEWSRHIQRTSANETGLEAELEAEKLEDGTLCYARVRQIKGGDFEVLELIPVIISRRIHKYAPTEFLDDALQPAQDLRELSPADRVFGWARQSKSKFRIKELSKEERGQSAYRGQIRISTVECTHAVVTRLDEDEKELGLSLSILGQPKPQQGRFYVAEDKHGNAQEANGINNEEAGYDRSGKGLRGRKVYPHHANLPSDYWQKPTDPNLETSGKDQGFFKEYRRPQKASGEEQRDNQNRSVQAWVEKGTTFEFDVHFTNLSDVELGALLWLLKLGKDHFFRLGGGKPLGFGSVSLELLGCDVRDGAAWREYYGSLDAHEEPDHNAGEHFAVKDASNQHKANSEQIVKAYQDAALASYKEVVLKAYRNGEESFEKISFIAAFLQAARGFVNEAGKCLPTHYPRARHETGSHLVPPHVDGLAYEWFVENAKKPRDNPETQIVLSDLVDQEGKPDRGLPILFHEPKGRG